MGNFREKSLILFLLMAVPSLGVGQTLLECSKIEDPSARVACYDQVAGRVEEKIQKTDQGATADRIEARQESLAEEIIGDTNISEKILTVTIDRVIRNKIGRVTFITTDGRYFLRAASSRTSWKPGEVLKIESGMLGSMFLVNSEGSKVKVQEVTPSNQD